MQHKRLKQTPPLSRLVSKEDMDYIIDCDRVSEFRKRLKNKNVSVFARCKDKNFSFLAKNTTFLFADENVSLEIFKYLLDKGLKLEEVDNNGTTSFIQHCYFGNAEIVDMLIIAGANVNAKNKFGISALTYATQYDRIEIVKMLLENGCIVTNELVSVVPHYPARNVLHNAAFQHLSQSHEESRYVALAKLLLDHTRGSFLFDRDEDGCTALDLALQEHWWEGEVQKDPEMVRLLVNYAVRLTLLALSSVRYNKRSRSVAKVLPVELIRVLGEFLFI
jgi:hypothetical protein